MTHSSVRDGRRTVTLGALVLVVSAVVLGWASIRGWYPFDEGMLGQSAERVLLGEVPHRDFADPYTGGLAVMHAAAFAIFGIKLTVLRYLLAAVAAVWIGGIYLVARRWVGPWRAAALALLVLVWSVPLYPAAVPSWYVLITVSTGAMVLATGGTRSFRTLLLTGALIGLGMLIKVTALFGLAGVFLALLRERQIATDRSRASVEIIVGTLLFAIMCAKVVAPAESSRMLVHAAGPAIVIALGIALAELRIWVQLGRAGFDRDIWIRCGILALGVGAALIPFGTWLVVNGALGAALAPLIDVGAVRARFASAPAPAIETLRYGLPAIAMLAAPLARRVRPPVVALFLLMVFVTAWVAWPWHRATWMGARALLPLGALACAITWAARPRTRAGSTEFTVFVAVASCMALSQFPYGAPIYFAYIAPLVFLALFGVAMPGPAATRHRDALLLFLLAFGAFQVLPGAAEDIGTSRVDPPALVTLDVPRGGLAVSPRHAREYRALVEAFGATPVDATIWAGPDAPEVAFLAARRSVNDDFFEFLAPPGTPTPFGTGSEQMAADYVVVNTSPAFSPRLTPDEVGRIAVRYPHVRKVGRFRIMTSVLR